MEGTNEFLRRVLNFTGPRHVRSSVDRVIAIFSGCIQEEFTITGFRWVSFTHTNIGGATLGRFCIGCSISVLQG